MRFLKVSSVLIFVFCQFLSLAQASGLVVDKMFIIADEKKNGLLTLTNTSDLPLFISANIDEFHVNEDGSDFIKTPYNANNVENWKISTTQNKLVLHSGESNNVGIRSLCYNVTCDSSRDLMFFVTFMPSPYRDPGDSSDMSSAMQLNYGFSPVFIIPTDKPDIKYKINRTDDNLVVENKSNTLIYVSVNSCDNDKMYSGCFVRYIVIAGRTKVFQLPSEIENKEITVDVASYDNSFNKHGKLNINDEFKD
ncbi:MULTISPECIES: hypothetical protein [Vibrio]|jgi:P pilus assembly chaperone PapD|uniref:Molecular chaperone n=3 Tax=Vibrio TaxID=662 RepID=A0A7Z1MK63_9VIBR|nr:MULTISPECIES: hypothetical protein [Vibrio]PMK78417.1 hypothetical protein BCT92_20465 [Vibrio sp. 10N.261.52.E5]PMP25112.1 hypothetical protein BCS91_12720 [Vibrio cyclitrophicus]PMP29937.1 hypothetical protein BCS90_00555 [Vibrio cyclitrophicus]TKF79307.1 hypothetical protein FCV65_22165 [Vibrio sp. F13]